MTEQTASELDFGNSTYPEIVKEKFVAIKEKTGMEFSEIQSQFEELVSQMEEMSKQLFPTAPVEARLLWKQKYSIGKLWTDLTTRQPLMEKQIIYVGHEGERKSKAGSLYTNLYVITQNERNVPTLTRIMGTGTMSEIYKKLNLSTRYNTTVMTFSDGGLSLDPRSEFSNPAVMEIPYQNFNAMLKIPEITVANASLNVSKKDKNNYVDSTDWKCIIGFISGRPRSFTKKDGTEGGVCTVTDVTVEASVADEHGNMTRPGFTIWASPALLIHNDGDYCAFYGSVTTDTLGKTSMNCYMITLLVPNIMQDAI